MAQLSRFELLEGKHSDLQSGKSYKKGDVIEDFRDLDLSFPGRFKKLAPGEKWTTPTVGTTAEGDTVRVRGLKAKAEPPAPPPAPDAAALSARGELVTETFKGVDDKLFEVFKRDKSFHVYEQGRLIALNEKPLTRGEVESFVTKWLES